MYTYIIISIQPGTLTWTLRLGTCVSGMPKRNDNMWQPISNFICANQTHHFVLWKCQWPMSSNVNHFEEHLQIAFVDVHHSQTTLKIRVSLRTWGVWLCAAPKVPWSARAKTRKTRLSNTPGRFASTCHIHSLIFFLCQLKAGRS